MHRAAAIATVEAILTKRGSCTGYRTPLAAGAQFSALWASMARTIHPFASAGLPFSRADFLRCAEFGSYPRSTHETSRFSRKEQGVLPRFAYPDMDLGVLGAAGMAAHL